MKIDGIHVLLTYQCTLECDHCFVWASPRQTVTMGLSQMKQVLDETKEIGTVEWVFFEGGEPLLFYASLLEAARLARGHGFRVGLVTNAYWATTPADARAVLRPLREHVERLEISADLYHGCEVMTGHVRTATAAAEELGFDVRLITIAPPEASRARRVTGLLPAGETAVMFRGRAARQLAGRVPPRPWTELDECPGEDLRDPGRLHVDPLGFVHICQGIVLGNLFVRSLGEIVARYDPEAHPITGPLVAGGPAELARRHGVLPADGDGYADACHLCDQTRRTLRHRFPEELGPDPIYGREPADFRLA
jgi:MoaA/NifB/PqqE/SkfB family radical SAM enzyme